MEFLDGELLFCAEPIFFVVTVLAASFLVEFIGTLSDLLLEFDVLWIACYGRWLLLRGICVHGGDSFEATVRPVEEWSQLPKIGAVKGVDCCVRR